MQIIVLRPIRRSAIPSPTRTVLFPSPAGVGLMPVTSTSLPRGGRAAAASAVTFALNRP